MRRCTEKKQNFNWRRSEGLPAWTGEELPSFHKQFDASDNREERGQVVARQPVGRRHWPVRVRDWRLPYVVKVAAVTHIYG
jgi:hypothetical protein